MVASAQGQAQSWRLLAHSWFRRARAAGSHPRRVTVPPPETRLSTNSFDARRPLQIGARTVEIFRLDALASRFDIARLPFSLRILLENLLRTEGNGSVTAADIEALAGWDPTAEPSKEIAFSPARVVMQDFTGVPAVVDLAAMRDAMADM